MKCFHFRVGASLLAWLFLVSFAHAQTFFIGTNAPDSGTNFAFTVPAGTTNLSLVVSNGDASYSYLLLKTNGTPTDADFDYISRLNGRTNQINLQVPEFVSGGAFGLRVLTPDSSSNHSFRVALTTNRTDLRLTNYPALKRHIFTTTGTITNEQQQRPVAVFPDRCADESPRLAAGLECEHDQHAGPLPAARTSARPLLV